MASFFCLFMFVTDEVIHFSKRIKYTDVCNLQRYVSLFELY